MNKLDGVENINTSLSTHYLIYRITNNINKKYYIGQHKTEDPFDDYMGSGIMIQQAETKYGLSNFSKEILFDFDNFDEMNNKEKELVQLSNCWPQDQMSYNLCEGGHGRLTNVTIQKIKDSWSILLSTSLSNYSEKMHNLNAGENNPMYGEKLSDHMELSDYKQLVENNRQHMLSLVIEVAKNRTGKSYEEQYGSCKANEIKKKIQVTNKNKTPEQKKETARKCKQTRDSRPPEIKLQRHIRQSIATTGENNGAYNRVWIFDPKTNNTSFVDKTEVDMYIQLGWKVGVLPSRSKKSGITFALNHLKKKYPTINFDNFDYSKYDPKVGKSRYQYLDYYVSQLSNMV